jgi:tetratricopeptide (TPR) repeat protein
MTRMQNTPGNDSSAISGALQQATDLADAGRSTEAIDVLARAIDRHGDVAELHTAQGWALENTSPPRWSEALAAYRIALAADPRQLWARLGQATALEERLGEAEAAAAAYTAAITLAMARAETEPEFLELLGWCEYRLGRLDDAVATFGRARALNPAWTAVRLDLGLVSLLRGDVDATAHFDAALDGLAECDPQRRVGALRVALDDLDEAIAATAALAFDNRTSNVRARLASELAAAR